MQSIQTISLPSDIARSIQIIEKILLRHGANKVILYGSLARGDHHAQSDIDICVEGLPDQNYFRAYAECLMQTQHAMSVLDFSNTTGYFRQRIIEEGKIIAMNVTKLSEEITFGLENLDKIHNNITLFSQQTTIDENILTAALTYECFGYYNAIEHLMLRFIKSLQLETPRGQFSHRDTLKRFYNILETYQIEKDELIIASIENLMAFRHVATKIYSFLIDTNKLKAIVNEIQENHGQINALFVVLFDTLRAKHTN